MPLSRRGSRGQTGSPFLGCQASFPVDSAVVPSPPLPTPSHLLPQNKIARNCVEKNRSSYWGWDGGEPCRCPPFLIIQSRAPGGPSRWRRSKTWRSPSSSQIHQKYIYTWNNSYRTPTERWQKTSDLPKGKKLPTYLGRAKEKRKNRDKRIGMGPAPLEGSHERGKLSTH